MISSKSRYRSFVLYQNGKEEFLGLRKPIDKREREDDRFHKVDAGDRIDLLAHKYLGDKNLWWIICEYNDIFFALELELGRVLQIPSYEYVHMRLLD